MDVLARRLKWLREKERYSQSEIAKKIGMTPSGYQKIEYSHRDPNLDVLVDLCNIFNVSADFLLGRANDIRELTQIEVKLQEVNKKIRNYKDKAEVSIYKISKLRKEMIDYANKYGFTDKITVELSEELDMHIDMHTEIIAEREHLESEKKKIIREYVEQFLLIPDCDPFYDDIIMRYYPYKTSIQMNLFDEFELILYGKEIGHLGTIKVFKDENEAVEGEKLVLTKLNGNRK